MPASSDTVERAVVLPKHLHARPAGQVAQAATRRPATTIELVAGERRANARSVLAVMGLGAVAGDEVRVIVSGPDAAAAADEIAEILGESVIFHIAEVADWEAAQESGDYRVSTRGRSLADETFIHACHRDQILGVAEACYADAGPLLLLTIDPAALSSPVREEEVQPGMVFPHIYGPINLAAVVAVTPLDRATGGAGAMRPPRTA